jgi:hypothetical protein
LLPGAAAVRAGDIAPHFTLFKDRRRTPNDLASINRRVRIEDIPDGTSNTILLSENVDAGVWYQNWASLPNELPTSSSPPVNTRDSDAVGNLGFVWINRAEYAPNFFPPTPDTQSPDDLHTWLPRPSSRHPAVVIAAFADGSARSINDNIGLLEWIRLVCPDIEKARTPVDNDGLGLSNL